MRARRRQGARIERGSRTFSAVHILQRSQADYTELEKQLRMALDSWKPVIVTEDDAHNINDVRLYVAGLNSPGGAGADGLGGDWSKEQICQAPCLPWQRESGAD